MQYILYIPASVLLLPPRLLLIMSLIVCEVVLMNCNSRLDKFFSMETVMELVMCLIWLSGSLLLLSFVNLCIFAFFFCGFCRLCACIVQEIIRVLKEFESVFDVFLFFGQELRSTDSKSS